MDLDTQLKRLQSPAPDLAVIACQGAFECLQQRAADKASSSQRHQAVLACLTHPLKVELVLMEGREEETEC
jgi:hypothetical protein